LINGNLSLIYRAYLVRVSEEKFITLKAGGKLLQKKLIEEEKQSLQREK